jgi:hypothetical protein
MFFKIQVMWEIKLLLSLITLFLVSSCANDSNSSSKENMNKFSLVVKNKLDEQVILLSYKHNTESDEVNELLLKYLQYFENATYQIITTGDINVEALKSKLYQNISLRIFLDQEIVGLKMNKNLAAKIIFDFKQLKANEELEGLSDRLQDLEYQIIELKSE